jgi:hypothetical protein
MYEFPSIGLELNAEKTEYVFMSRDQYAGQNNIIKIRNKSFERMEEFKYVVQWIWKHFSVVKIRKYYYKLSF